MKHMTTKKWYMSILSLITMTVSLLLLTACGGIEEYAFSDLTGDVETSVQAGALDTIKGKYLENGSDGNYVVFGDTGDGFYAQHGKYEIGEDTVALSYDVAEGSMEYSISEDGSDDTIVLLKNGDIELACTYFNGTAGLHDTQGLFTGTYSVDDGTQIVFNDDGTFRQVQEFKYALDGSKLTETFQDSDVTYTWETDKDELLLKINDTTVQTLVPVK